MGNPTGFLEIDKKERYYEDPKDRLKHFKEFIVPLTNEEVSKQGSRCMDCGIPYCHQGCPVNNLIPDWNDLVYKHEWKKALDTLHSTNNFPEFTGRICPAPCEAACTLNLTDNPVSIKTIECSIVDYGWEKGWIKPQLPKKHTDKKVAIIGSGPAGLACAQQLARLGHNVVVYEKNERIGGLLRMLDSYKWSPDIGAALRLAPHIFLRPSELSGLKWSEVDFNENMIRISPDRMKMKRTHLVPMSKQVTQILQSIKTDREFVFASPRTLTKHINPESLRAGLRRLGINRDELTTHGFRHMASTRLNELGFNSDIIERQLAHCEQNKVKAAYNHAEYITERKLMMQEWSDYLDQLKNQ